MAAPRGVAAPEDADAAPYLDMLCVAASRVAPLSECGEHNRLLVEPLVMPALDHTGLRSVFEADGLCRAGQPDEGAGQDDLHGEHPLFYPDGRKKKNFRRNVRLALRQAEAAEADGYRCGALELDVGAPSRTSTIAEGLSLLDKQRAHATQRNPLRPSPKRRTGRRAPRNHSRSRSPSPSHSPGASCESGSVALIPRLEATQLGSSSSGSSSGSSLAPARRGGRSADKQLRNILGSIRREQQRIDALTLH